MRRPDHPQEPGGDAEPLERIEPGEVDPASLTTRAMALTLRPGRDDDGESGYRGVRRIVRKR